MNLFTNKTPWYIAGLAFECTECGRCCAGPEEGYVWLTADEALPIAAKLGITRDDLLRRYARRVAGKYTILEHKTTKDCIFLGPRPMEDGRAAKGCRVYGQRPAQCRTWPFWPSNLASPGDWAEAADRCPGINRGKLFSFEEIEQRRIATGH